MDDIPVDLWKAAAEGGVGILGRICKLWAIGMANILVPGGVHSTPKKGKLKECSNYRTK